MDTYYINGRHIQSRDLWTLLDWLGFEREKTCDDRLFFRHPSSGAEVRLPACEGDEVLDQRQVGNVWSILNSFGVMDRVDFDIWLWQNDRTRSILRRVGPVRPDAAVTPDPATAPSIGNGRKPKIGRPADRRTPAAV